MLGFAERAPEGAPRVPRSIEIEHREILDALAAEMRADGSIGQAARELAALLYPHFRHEQRIVLEPLGALAAIAAGGSPANAAVLPAVADVLREELPQLDAEQSAIIAACRRLADAGRRGYALDAIAIADRIRVCMIAEYELLYPATLLAAEVVRARREHADAQATAQATAPATPEAHGAPEAPPALSGAPLAAPGGSAAIKSGIA